MPIFLLAFQNTANFLSLVQPTKFLGKVTAMALEAIHNKPGSTTSVAERCFHPFSRQVQTAISLHRRDPSEVARAALPNSKLNY